MVARIATTGSVANALLSETHLGPRKPDLASSRRPKATQPVAILLLPVVAVAAAEGEEGEGDVEVEQEQSKHT